jgi:hypothetical protein
LPSAQHSDEQYFRSVCIAPQMGQSLNAICTHGLADLGFGFALITHGNVLIMGRSRLPVRHSMSVSPALLELHCLQHGTRLPS